MTDTGKPEDLMDYEGLAQEALRGVVRGALRRGLDPQACQAPTIFTSLSRPTDPASAPRPTSSPVIRMR